MLFGQMPFLPGDRMPFGSSASFIVSCNCSRAWSLLHRFGEIGVADTGRKFHSCLLMGSSEKFRGKNLPQGALRRHRTYRESSDPTPRRGPCAYFSARFPVFPVTG